MRNTRKLQTIRFPDFTGVCVNMMPIVMGDASTLPPFLQHYLPLIESCDFEKGTVVYLTIHESIVKEGQSQRRGGIHTEAFNAQKTSLSWGGGGTWGGQKGIYMASTDGACRIWPVETSEVDSHGQVLKPQNLPKANKCEAHVMYWMTDQTPHEALPSQGGPRQFFRLVSSDLSVWHAKHNTPNPLGILPDCQVIQDDKFS